MASTVAQQEQRKSGTGQSITLVVVPRGQIATSKWSVDGRIRVGPSTGACRDFLFLIELDGTAREVEANSGSNGRGVLGYFALEIRSRKVLGFKFGFDFAKLRDDEIVAALFDALDASTALRAIIDNPDSHIDRAKVLLSFLCRELTDPRFQKQVKARFAAGKRRPEFVFNANQLDSFLYEKVPNILPWVVEISNEHGDIAGHYTAALGQHVRLLRTYRKAVRLTFSPYNVLTRLKSEQYLPGWLEQEIEGQLNIGQKPVSDAKKVVFKCARILYEFYTRFTKARKQLHGSGVFTAEFSAELKKELAAKLRRFMKSVDRLWSALNESAKPADVGALSRLAKLAEGVCLASRDAWLHSTLALEGGVRDPSSADMKNFLEYQLKASDTTHEVYKRLPKGDERKRILREYWLSNRRRWIATDWLLGKEPQLFIKVLETSTRRSPALVA